MEGLYFVNLLIIIILIVRYHQVFRYFMQTHVTDSPLILGPRYLRDSKSDLHLKSSVLENTTASKQYSYNLWLNMDNVNESTGSVKDKVIFSHGNSKIPYFSLIYSADKSVLKYKFSDRLLDNASETTLPQQTWVNISINIDQNLLDIYINGKLLKSRELTDYFPHPPSGFISLKCKECSNERNPSGVYGYIDIFRYYNEYLEPKRVKSMYEAGKPRDKEAPSDNVFWWTG